MITIVCNLCITNKSYKMEPVFVYGTLKQNQPNNYCLNDTENGCAVFRSVAVTINKYPLVISTKFNIPFLLQKEGSGHEIKGEIYDVDTTMLEFLDDFENHPDFYKRQKIQVKLPNGDIIDCWIYLLPKYPDSYLSLQYFDNYDSCGEHGLSYVTRYQRDPNDELSFPNWKSSN